jgi:hypothetical protein
MPRGVPKSAIQRLVAELKKAKQELEAQLRHIVSVLHGFALGGTASTKQDTRRDSKRRRSTEEQAAQEKATRKRWAKYQVEKKEAAKPKS